MRYSASFASVMRLTAVAVCRLVPFALAVPCALLAPFFVLSIPGDPATTERQWAYWLALWGSLVIYPVVVAVLGIRLWTSGTTDGTRGLWYRIWIVLGLQIALWTPILGMVAHDAIGRSQARANMPIEQKMEYAIWHGSPDEARSLVEAGADVNMRLFNDGTAGQFAAEQGDWDLVIWLIERGASIDHHDLMGRSMRTAVAEAPDETDPERATALAALRAIIADTEAAPKGR